MSAHNGEGVVEGSTSSVNRRPTSSAIAPVPIQMPTKTAAPKLLPKRCRNSKFAASIAVPPMGRPTAGPWVNSGPTD